MLIYVSVFCPTTFLLKLTLKTTDFKRNYSSKTGIYEYTNLSINALVLNFNFLTVNA